MSDLIDRCNLRLMRTEECAGHTIEYALGWKACIEWMKTLPSARPDVPDRNVGDMIGRRAALNAFGLSEKTRKYGGDHSGYNTMMLYEIQDVLDGLPSAMPGGRYINADELIKRLKQEGLNDAVKIAVKMAGHERVGKRG